MLEDGDARPRRHPPEIADLDHPPSRAGRSEESGIDRIREVMGVAVEAGEDLPVEFGIHVNPVGGSREALILACDPVSPLGRARIVHGVVVDHVHDRRLAGDRSLELFRQGMRRKKPQKGVVRAEPQHSREQNRQLPRGRLVQGAAQPIGPDPTGNAVRTQCDRRELIAMFVHDQR